MKSLGFGVNELRQFITILPILVFVFLTTPFTLLMQVQTKRASLRDKTGYVSIALLVTGVWIFVGAAAWSLAAPLTSCVPVALSGAVVTALGVVIDRRFLLVGNMYQYATKELPDHLGIDWEEVDTLLAAPLAPSSWRLWLLRSREWPVTWIGSVIYFVGASTLIDALYPLVQSS